MMARLDVAASAVHWHMPFHQARIIGRRHHAHAADRQVNGQPSPPRRSRRAVMQRSRRAARSRFTDPIEGGDHLLLCDIRHRHLSIGRHYPARMSQFIAPIYVGRTFEPGFSVRAIEWIIAASRAAGALLRELLSQGVQDMAIKEFSDSVKQTPLCPDCCSIAVNAHQRDLVGSSGGLHPAHGNGGGPSYSLTMTMPVMQSVSTYLLASGPTPRLATRPMVGRCQEPAMALG